MKIGILGTGFGMVHADIYRKIDSVESITIFGRNKEKLDKIHKDTGINVTDNAKDILANSKIDLVDICLPSSIHKEYAIEALKNGKDVFCETPVCLSLEDAHAMKKAEEQYGKRVFVNMFIRHQYPYEYIYNTLKNNSLGKLKALHVKRETPPLWGDLSLNNIVINLMIHEFDFIAWLLDKPNMITSFGINGKKGQSHVNAILSYEDTLVNVQGSSMMPLSHPFAVACKAVFENGTIEYTGNGYSDRFDNSLTLFTEDKKEDIKVLESDCYKQAAQHVIDCCIKGIPTVLSLDDAIRSLKTVLHIKDSIAAEVEILPEVRG